MSFLFSSVAQSCPTLCDPWTAARQASLSVTNTRSLLKLMSIESVMPSNHLILCCLLLLMFSIFPSIRGISSESALHIRWPKYWSFTFSIILPMNIRSWLPLGLSVLMLLLSKKTLKNLLLHHSLKVSILQCSAFFMVQLSHLYVTNGKSIALTARTFVSKVMSLLFNTLSRFVIAFLPRRKHLLILWPQSPSILILQPKKIVCHRFHFFPFYLLWRYETRCHDLSFFFFFFLTYWILSQFFHSPLLPSLSYTQYMDKIHIYIKMAIKWVITQNFHQNSPKSFCKHRHNHTIF